MQSSLEISLELCKGLEIPNAEHKLEGPAPVLSFLGIEIDTTSSTLRLPPEKLGRLKSVVTLWLPRICCRRRELLPLIGQLQHACRVVRAGRTFLLRMIDLSVVPKELNQWVCLNSAFRSDLHRWVVGGFPRRLEWNWAMQQCTTRAPISDSDIGCIWGMELWGLHAQRRMVSVPIA